MAPILARALAALLFLLSGAVMAQGSYGHRLEFFGQRPPAARAANAPGAKSQAIPMTFNARQMLMLRHLDEVELALPSGRRHSIVFELAQSHGAGVASWVGRLKDHGNHYRVIITTGPGGSFGLIETPQGTYRIVPGDGHDWLVDMTLEGPHVPVSILGDDARVPELATKSAIDPSSAAFVAPIPGVNTVSTSKTTPSLVTIDIMFVVTQGLADRLGANLATRLNFLITRANTAYADSEIGITLRLANVTIVDYSDAIGDIEALDDITPVVGGFNAAVFGAIETTRAVYGADMVTLWRDGDPFNGSGLAWAPSVTDANYMYSTVKGCVFGCEWVWIHEVGHNMGNRHDRPTSSWQANAGPGYTAFASGYSFGYAFCKGGAYTCDPFVPDGCASQPECAPLATPDPSNFADIMAYFLKTTDRIYKFSNPAVTCVSTAPGSDGIPRPCGIAQGLPDAADTATTMNNVRAAISVLKTPYVWLTVSKAGTGTGSVISSPAAVNCGATCSASFPPGVNTNITLTAAAGVGSVFTGWGGACSGTGTCQLVMSAARAVTANFATAAGSPTGAALPTAVAFGGQSVQTTSPGIPVTFTNIGSGTLTVSGVTVSNPAFARTHNCAALALGASCTATVTFTPAAEGASTGNLTFATSAGNIVVPLTGTGELSLVKHFYWAILNRVPEPGGQEFWEAESARLQALGANINEIWFVMANYFFNSPEYLAANKTDTQFLTDLYYTFFNRPPDGGGMAFWQSQMDAGLSREGVTFWFMFSNEFRTFTQGIFGSTAARPEVDMVMDLFRGILNRFPDTPAFNAFVGTLRTAQCNGAGPVYTAVNDMSYFFLFGAPEYAGRNRTNTQYVSDMYNAFLRRGGADSEVDFWINQLDTAAKDRNQLRADFIASPEFGARVNAVIAAGCLP